MARNTVVLIRGINVGRAKRVAMADLRDLIGKLGYSDVRTILNSGNVVFNDSLSDPVSAGERIEEAIAAHLGVSARVTALTVTELDAIVRDNPLLDQAEIPSRLIVAVFSQPRLVSLVEPLLEQVWTPELLALGARVVYAWCPDGVLSSRLLKSIDRLAGDDMTARNWASVLKIHAVAKE